MFSTEYVQSEEAGVIETPEVSTELAAMTNPCPATAFCTNGFCLDA